PADVVGISDLRHEPNLIGKHHYLLGEDSLLSVLAWVPLSCGSVAERCRQVVVNGWTRERGKRTPSHQVPADFETSEPEIGWELPSASNLPASAALP
ncbi:MAG TPA: hypothetical protein VEN79_00250, partial [Terriglobia bacterium]|nr:hypothetical protein [Terriglobia bacterium]